MAATKPMGINKEGQREGVTGFVQEYNQEPGPRQDLNPAVVDDPSVLPAAQTPKAPKAPTAAPKARARKAKK